jgi:hypothetical protein
LTYHEPAGGVSGGTGGEGGNVDITASLVLIWDSSFDSNGGSGGTGGDGGFFCCNAPCDPDDQVGGLGGSGGTGGDGGDFTLHASLYLFLQMPMGSSKVELENCSGDGGDGGNGGDGCDAPGSVGTGGGHGNAGTTSTTAGVAVVGDYESDCDSGEMGSNGGSGTCAM